MPLLPIEFHCRGRNITRKHQRSLLRFAFHWSVRRGRIKVYASGSFDSRRAINSHLPLSRAVKKSPVITSNLYTCTSLPPLILEIKDDAETSVNAGLFSIDLGLSLSRAAIFRSVGLLALSIPFLWITRNLRKIGGSTGEGSHDWPNNPKTRLSSLGKSTASESNRFDSTRNYGRQIEQQFRNEGSSSLSTGYRYDINFARFASSSYCWRPLLSHRAWSCRGSRCYPCYGTDNRWWNKFGALVTFVTFLVSRSCMQFLYSFG